MRRLLLSGIGLSLCLGALAVACGGSDGGGAVGGSDGGTDDGSAGSNDGASALDGAKDGAPGSSDGGGTIDGGDAGPDLLPAGAACTTDAQCKSNGCDDTGHCAVGRSCTQANGGRTCGPTGTESCCTAIPVPKPKNAFTLDKYSITAGRYRVFVDKTGGDVRGYVHAHRPAWFDPAWEAWLPNKMDDGTAVTGTSHVFAAGQGLDGVYQQLGPIHYGTEGPGNEGCLTKEVGNARTYRLPDAVNTSLFADTQQYAQDALDQKPMQCATFYMLAAFCIWDGGRIPTLAELDYAWDAGDVPNHLYPWGNTPAPGGWNFAFDTQAHAMAFGVPSPDGGVDQTVANYKYNYWLPDTLSCINDDPNACDYSIFLAPPGRFPKGNGPFGHSDLAGDVYSIAMPPSSQAGVDPAVMTAGLARTGAFDNHAIPSQHPVGGFRTYTASNKYLAVGGRCAR
jgi:formylglycine-generating enzyme required for sulfatase activity